MGTPARNLIIENVATTLAGITVAGGYKTTVTTVSRVIKNWNDVLSSEFPLVCFAFPKENIVHQPFGLLEVKLRGHIIGHVNTGTDALRSDLLSNFQDDIIAILQIDTTRGRNAISTTIGGQADAETDEGDPDTMDTRGGTGTLVLPVEIFYQRTVNQS